ncbi:554_t:CDS:1, partial [Scutellospora calospora]
ESYCLFRVSITFNSYPITMGELTWCTFFECRKVMNKNVKSRKYYASQELSLM